jgi:uncharacterized protein (DUF924 family)
MTPNRDFSRAIVLCVPDDGETAGMKAGTKTTTDDARIDSLLDFWFEGHPTDAPRLEALKKKWFFAGTEQDRELERSFGPLATAAAAGVLDAWADAPRGRLALIILLDQLPRSLNRGTSDAFGQDAKALELCLDGLDTGLEKSLRPLERVFFCMPLQHSESQVIQTLAVETFGRLAEADVEPAIANLLRDAADSAVAHREIVDRFGRFPHRNKALGRKSTTAEFEYLASGGSSFGQ